MERVGELRIHTHGTSGPTVVVLHGGPAAVGSAAPLARGLADAFRVLEPWQRGSGPEPLTVARHVEDLHELVVSRCEGARPALVGESWGAMLALAYAAAHPDSAGPLVLVGCGTFDPAARARLGETLDQRMDDDLRRRMERLPDEFPDPGEQMRKRYELIESLYTYEAIDSDNAPGPPEPLDIRAHEETWADMVRLQETGGCPGAYPAAFAAFAAIRSPVLMLHGTYDPHPGEMIRASLEPVMPQLEYRQWDRCGHSPWREKHVRDEFFAVMRQWLGRHLT